MKTTKQIFILAFFIFSFAIFVKAQSGAIASGGVASGTTGNVSFSVGQTNCITTNGTGGTISQGLQQPYEIFITTGVDKQNINLTYSAYPNPTSDFILLNISNSKNMHFSLIDVQGKLLLNEKINSDETKINFAEINTGTYFIKVSSDNDTILKTFKIIKY